MGIAFLPSLDQSSAMVLPMKAMTAMKEMKAMKTGVLTTAGAYSSVAETMGLKPKDVKAAVEGLLGLAAAQIKKNGAFKLAGMLNLKLKVKPARPSRKGVNPFTKEPCVFKARPASKTVKVFPMKQLKAMVN